MAEQSTIIAEKDLMTSTGAHRMTGRPGNTSD